MIVSPFMGDEPGGVQAAEMSDADLLRVGGELAGAHVVIAACASCGARSPAMPDGVRYLAARLFAAGYRLRELGPDRCSDWLSRLCGEPDTDAVAEPPSCRLGLGDGRHAYASEDGRRWACPCGSRLLGSVIAFTWPGSPFDGRTYVVTDAQLDSFVSSGLIGADALFDAAARAARRADPPTGRV